MIHFQLQCNKYRDMKSKATYPFLGGVAGLLFNPMRSNPPSVPSESVLTLLIFLSGRSFLPDMIPG